MRRILMLMGVALLAFPLVAFGQVKVRTKVGGFISVPAGDVMTKGFKAPVKAGPFTLGFHTQMKWAFEANSNWDFDSDLGDGESNNSIPQSDIAGRNSARGLALPGDANKGELFVQETRFGMDAVTGPLSTHIVMEDTFGGAKDRTTENTDFHMERAWGDVDLDWFNFRIGVEFYAIEPTWMIYGDDDPMMAIYKNYGTWAWRLTYMKRVDGDESARGNGLGNFQPGDQASSDNNAEGKGKDVDVFMAFAEVPLENFMGPGTLSIQPFYIFDSDRRFKRGTNSDGSIPARLDGTITGHYLGSNIIGNIGPVKATFSGAYHFGSDDTGFNAVSSATGLPKSDVDINAWQFFADLAYPVPDVPLTIQIGAYVASGDDDPFDSDASGFLGVSHNSELHNGRDIFVDKSYDGGSLNLRLQDSSGVARAGEAIALSGDDDAIPIGLSSFNNVTVAATGLHPTRLAGAALPTPGSDINDLDPYRINNRSHPGVAITNLALHYKILSNVTASADYQHIRYMKPGGLSPVSANRSPDGILTKGGDIDGEFGNQFSFYLKYKVAKFLTIAPRIVVLVPGDGVKDLTGEDDTATSFNVDFRWNF